MEARLNRASTSLLVNAFRDELISQDLDKGKKEKKEKMKKGKKGTPLLYCLF